MAREVGRSSSCPNQTEIQQHDAATIRTRRIGRLQIPVQQLGGVESAKTLGELGEDMPQKRMETHVATVQSRIYEEIAAFGRRAPASTASACPPTPSWRELHEVEEWRTFTSARELPLKTRTNWTSVAVQELERGQATLLVPGTPPPPGWYPATPPTASVTPDGETGMCLWKGTKSGR